MLQKAANQVLRGYPRSAGTKHRVEQATPRSAAQTVWLRHPSERHPSERHPSVACMLTTRQNLARLLRELQLLDVAVPLLSQNLQRGVPLLPQPVDLLFGYFFPPSRPARPRPACYRPRPHRPPRERGDEREREGWRVG